MLSFEEVDAKDFRTALNILKQVDQEVKKNLSNKLKSELQPYATQLAEQMPQIAPVSGMIGTHPTAYKPPKGKVSFTPGTSSKTASRLLSIQLDSGKQRGFYIADLAGTRSNGFTNSGKALIRVLNERAPLSSRRRKGGRYGWKNFIKIYGPVREKSLDIINSTLKELERKLD